MEELREAPVSGHIFRRKRESGDRWMAKWRVAAGQHQRVIGKAWIGRGRPPEGQLTRLFGSVSTGLVRVAGRPLMLVSERAGAPT